MNILLIHQYFLEKDDGGGSRFNEMTRNWAEQGNDIEVLGGMVHYASGKKRDRYRGKYTFIDQFYERVRVIRCHVSEAYNAGFLGRLWGYFSFTLSATYAGLFKIERKPDVILVTSPPLFVGITAYILAKLRRVPFVFEVRDLWPESAIDTGVLNNGLMIKAAYWFEAFIYKRATLINVLTPAFRDTLIQKKKVPAEKVIFIPNAADFTLSDAIIEDFDRERFREEHGLAGKKVITYVGAHGVANHLIQVIETAELLRDRPEVLFQLVGNGPQKSMLVEEARERGLTNVKFVDSVPKMEVFKYILASDFGTSVLKKVDTFKTIYSNKTFDYMACSKPIFMAIDGVSRKLVEDAACGVYVAPENPRDFADKILQTIALPDTELARQGQSGYAYAKQHFDRMRLADQYLTALKRAAGQLRSEPISA